MATKRKPEDIPIWKIVNQWLPARNYHQDDRNKLFKQIRGYARKQVFKAATVLAHEGFTGDLV